MRGITSAILLHADLSTRVKNSENRKCKAHSLRTAQIAAPLVQKWSMRGESNGQYDLKCEGVEGTSSR